MNKKCTLTTKNRTIFFGKMKLKALAIVLMMLTINWSLWC